MSLEPLETPANPSYPHRLARRGGVLGAARRLGAAIAATAALLAAPAHADDDWIFWLEDMDFCPTMDCNPPGYRTAGVSHTVARVRGSLSAAIIRQYVRQQANGVRGCYERRLQQSPRLSGRVAVRFVIQHDGNVAAANIAESTLGDAQLEACVRDVVASITFPVAEGNGLYVVTYPFRFQRRQTAQP
jgi:TonB family protein